MPTHTVTPRAVVVAVLLPLFACGCPGGKVTRTGPPPLPADLVAHLEKLPERARNITAETLSDARIGKDRAKLKVYILAEWGGKLRFLAMNPNDSTAADLASDGASYCVLDSNNNCGQCGPATPAAVGSMIQIELPPDDIVRIVLGGTPLIEGEATVRWDASAGHEILDITSQDGRTQRVVLDGRDRRWDVLESEVKDAQGKRLWKLRHKDFRAVKKFESDEKIRLPQKSFFERPGNDALIVWKSQDVDKKLPPERFQLEVPAGLPVCGGGNASAGGGGQ